MDWKKAHGKMLSITGIRERQIKTITGYYYTPTTMSKIKRLILSSVGKDVE